MVGRDRRDEQGQEVPPPTAVPEVVARVGASFGRQGLMRLLGARLTLIAVAGTPAP